MKGFRILNSGKYDDLIEELNTLQQQQQQLYIETKHLLFLQQNLLTLTSYPNMDIRERKQIILYEVPSLNIVAAGIFETNQGIAICRALLLTNDELMFADDKNRILVFTKPANNSQASEKDIPSSKQLLSFTSCCYLLVLCKMSTDNSRETEQPIWTLSTSTFPVR